jgi:hypothetical protein
MFFLLCLLNDRRIRIRILEAQKHVDPVDPDPDSDPDPQHCFFGFLMVIVTPLKIFIALFHSQSSVVKYFSATLVVC